MLNDREAFKAGFLKRCADQGLSHEETLAAVKQANVEMEKGADWLTDLLGKAYGIATPALLAGPPALGVGGAYLYSRATDTDDTDVQAVSKKELAELYRAQAKRIRESRRRYASS